MERDRHRRLNCGTGSWRAGCGGSRTSGSGDGPEETHPPQDGQGAPVRSHLANTAIDDTRRRVQNHTLGHRGHKHDPLHRGRRVFLTGFDRLTDERIAWMFDMLAAGDPDGEVGAAIVAKELLREVYAARDLAHARRRLIVFMQHCADADVPELTRLARTIDRWRDEVLAYHHTSHASNGRVENVHMLAEKIRRNAHGFTNHHNYRRRLIGRLGIKWTTVTTRRIRGRQPRSVA